MAKGKEIFTKIIDVVKKICYILFNLAYVGAFISYTVFSFYNKSNGQSIVWLPYVLIAVTLVYFISFIFILFGKEDDKEVKQDVKTYKSSLKIFKKLLKLSNLVMTVVMITNTVMYDRSWFSLGLAIANITLVIIQILSSLVKMLKKEKKRKIKEEKQELRQDLVNDIKNIVDEQPEEELVVNDSVLVQSANAKKVVKIVNNADKITKRVAQYSEDKKQVGKKKKKNSK